VNIDEMKMLVRLNVLLKTDNKSKVDFVRYANEPTYAAQVLSDASSSENEELVLLSLQLMQRQGILAAAPIRAAPQRVQAKPPPVQLADSTSPPEIPKQKYTGRLR
jgi:hypothetical protein